MMREIPSTAPNVLDKKIIMNFLEQHLDYGTVDEVFTNDEDRDCLVAFDAILEKENEKISRFFIRGTFEKLDVLLLY